MPCLSQQSCPQQAQQPRVEPPRPVVAQPDGNAAMGWFGESGLGGDELGYLDAFEAEQGAVSVDEAPAWAQPDDAASAVDGEPGAASSASAGTGAGADAGHDPYASEAPRENRLVVREPQGVCGVIGPQADRLMDGFVAEVAALLQPWYAVRSTPEPRFDGRPIDAAYRRFRSAWIGLEENWEADGTQRGLEASPVAMDELDRRLRAIGADVLLMEIRAFHPAAAPALAAALGVREDDVAHTYSLLLIAGVSASVPLGVLESSNAMYEVVYSNDLGMGWSRVIGCATSGTGVSVGLAPIGLDVASSFGSEDINAGQAVSREYFGPGFFDIAGVVYAEQGGGVGAGFSIGGMTLTDGQRSLTFDTTGATALWGTSTAGSAGVSGGLGLCRDTGLVDEDLVLPELGAFTGTERSGAWEPLIEAELYFPTGAAELDAEGQATVDALIGAMYGLELEHRGARFHVTVVGRASRRWRGATGDATPEELNEQLAQERAAHTEQALVSGLLAAAPHFTRDVIHSSSLVRGAGAASGTEADDNRSLDRSVQVAVSYNLCGDDGKVAGAL